MPQKNHRLKIMKLNNLQLEIYNNMAPHIWYRPKDLNAIYPTMNSMCRKGFVAMRIFSDGTKFRKIIKSKYNLILYDLELKEIEDIQKRLKNLTYTSKIEEVL